MTALEADLARLRYQLKSVALSEKERSAASDSLRAKLARLESEELPRQKASADAAIAEAVRHLQSLKEAQDVTDSTLLSMEDLRRTCGVCARQRRWQ